MERNDKKAKIKVELNKRNKGETSNTRGNVGEDKFYVPHPLCVEIERLYGDLLSSIENEEHIVFDMIEKQRVGENISLGKLHDVLFKCKNQYEEVLGGCFSVVNRASQEEADVQHKEELTKLESRIDACKRKLAKASNWLFQHGEGSFSVDLLAKNTEEEFKKLYPGSKPKTYIKTRVIGPSGVDIYVSDAVKEWENGEISENTRMSLSVDVGCVDSLGDRDKSLYVESNGNADLEDEQADGKPFVAHIAKIRYGEGWTFDEPRKALVKQSTKYLYWTQYKGWGGKPSPQEVDNCIAYSESLNSPDLQRVIDAGYYENESESQEKKES